MNRYITRLLLILAVSAFAIWVDLPNNQDLYIPGVIEKDIDTHLGLDLVGGVQALLQADLPEGAEIDPEAMNTARDIVESRANGLLGVGEAMVQRAGDNRIVVELPGETDPEKALETLGEIGQLEFVDLGGIPASQIANLIGTTIQTDYQATEEPSSDEGPVFHTVMTGESLDNVAVQRDELGRYLVAFSLDQEGAEIFSEYTANNVGGFLAIVLDKEIISAPQVQGHIPGGRGSISGNFTSESANSLAIQLRYGSLPIPLVVVESRTVGPSLGQDSLRKSLVAGVIGLGIVVLFMAMYYRLPGVLADLALLVYAAVTFALFKLIPVTLTLPGIAGFVLSIGVAVDANILIFERMKEELRDGRSLRSAIDTGWERAWPSIRDSNLSTLITCAILFWFGSAFGASIVKGFAVTLSIGVVVSLFTALFVTRTFLHMLLDRVEFQDHLQWFGAY